MSFCVTEVLTTIFTYSMQSTDMDGQDSSGETLKAIAYERLSSYLQEHEDHVCEIEVLPPAVQPPDGVLIHDGLNLGVPKKILVLAYVEARRRFLHHKDRSHSSLEALQATKVMLLFDSEHLTAVNYRKRWLVRMRAFGMSEQKLLFRELNFLNSILTSPLHRQTKSPTLWHHRLWILDSLWTVGFEKASLDQKATFWRAELAAVCKSGERHPKNYYAWQYARRLVPRLTHDDKEDFADVVRDWCFKHPSDISGWSFLLVLLPEIHSETKALDILMHVIKYAIRLQAEQESLWIFIRTAAVRNVTQKEYLEACALLQDQDKKQYAERTGFTPRWATLRDQFLHLRDRSVNSV